MTDSQLQRLRHSFANFLLEEEIPCSECAEVINEIEEILNRYLVIRSRMESQKKEDLVNAYRIFNDRKILDGLVRATRDAEKRDPESYRIRS